MRRENLDAWDVFEAAVSAKAGVAALERLAADDDVDALGVLDMLYRHGWPYTGKQTIRPDAKLALRYAERGAALGDACAMTSLAGQLDRRGGDWHRAQRLYRAAFAKGYTTAAYNFARGYLVRGNHRAAVRWFRIAYAAGDGTSALFEVAKAELYGIGTKRDPKAAFTKLRRIARSRDVFIPENWQQCEAMLLMAHTLFDGLLVPIDHDQGMTWLRKAAAAGSPVARAELAR